VIRRFVTNVDPIALAAAASALAGHGVLVEHVAVDACGVRLLDVVESVPVQKGS
jgi:hypothetical protein